MQLKSLDIHGFKSFANREKLLFDGSITGIVGPNGCGKSNIVDAIRWVLGEQKTRKLRSDKMENVIFNGTKDRRKAGVAEVSLTFENTKNILPTEYTTITITRKLYRSGDSEYQINGVTCRLKDIQNLFMDTGVSSDSYAIIELKMVDEILTNRHGERRRFLEEAAGISKYKIRKKETLRRLDATDADLERVDDLLFEIDKQLKSLERQARRTRQYFELKEAYQHLSSQFAFLKLRDLSARRTQYQKQLTEVEDKLSGLQSETAQREARLAQLRKELLDHEKNLSGAQYDLNEHLRRIQRAETDKSVKNERLKYLQQREVSIVGQLETERQQLRTHEQQIAEIRVRREQIRDKLTQLQSREAELREKLEAARQAREAAQESSDALNARHREAEQAARELQQDIEIKRVQVQSLEAELERTEADRSQRRADIGAFSEKSESLQAERKALQTQLDELTARQETHEREKAELEETMNALKDSVYRKNRLHDAKQNEYQLTKSLVENLEGFPESVKFLKKNADWIKDAPLLGDVLGVPEAYKVAIENYLESYLSYYVVESLEDARLAVHLLAKSAKGRANFFILNELDDYSGETPLIFTQARPALELVEAAPEHRKLAAYLLNKVYLVESESDIPDGAPDSAIFLTRDGGFSRRRFSLGGGSLGLFQGKRLGRAQNLKKLDKELKQLNRQLAEEKLKLDDVQQRWSQLRNVSFRNEIDTLQRRVLEKQRDLEVLENREREYREFLDRVGARAGELEERLTNFRRDIETGLPKLRIHQETLTQLTSQLAQQRAETQERIEAANAQSAVYNEAQIELIQVQNQDAAFARDLARLDETIARLNENNEKLRAEHQQLKADVETLVQSTHQDDDTMVALYEQKRGFEDRVEGLEEKVAMAKNGITQVEEAAAGLRQQRESLLGQRQEVQEQLTELRVAFGSIEERMRVEFQVEVDNLSEAALFEAGEADRVNLQKLEEKLHKRRNKLQHFGDINPLAVEAFDEMQERAHFIRGQKDDLIQAKETLLGTIAEIDAEAEAKFLETYAQVRENFQEVFRHLFTNDDTADLILKQPDNPLESDVGIIARPKGKRPQTISQLSGGEKTLTAVALLFSLYLIKPAPFCIFDEVDAPLDDANIDKFNNIIRDFSDRSQFIIVTHNKRTMAATRLIYGVTMENLGISKVLPVDLGQIYGETHDKAVA